MIEGNNLLRIRCGFLYGGEWPFRLRIMSHTADRLKERSLQDNTILQSMKNLAAVLQNSSELLNLEKPKDGASIMYYIEESSYMVVVAFHSLKRDDIEFDVIIETYLRCNLQSPRLRSSAKDRCIAILKDGSVIEGKHNKWFF